MLCSKLALQHKMSTSTLLIFSPIWQIWVDVDQIWCGVRSLLVIITCKFKLRNFAHLDPKFIPRNFPWGWTGDEPYFLAKLAHIWSGLTFLARIKNGIANFYFRYQLAPKFIPKSWPWGSTGDEMGMNLIYWPNWPIFGLDGPFWQRLRMG